MRSFNPLAPFWSEVLWGRESPSNDQIKTVSMRLKTLWPKLAKARGQSDAIGDHYSVDSRLAETYAAYYLPVNALKSSVVLSELQRLAYPFLNWGNKIKWLDLGCGPGTAAWGLAQWLSESRDLAIDYLGLDRSREFVSLASRSQGVLSSASDRRLSAQFRAQSIGSKHEKGSNDVLANEVRSADIISLFNCIAELEPDPSQRAEFLFHLCDELQGASRKSGRRKLLIIVEPGTRTNSRELLEWRQRFIDEGTRFAGARILTPCMSNRRCGALEKKDDWCHESIGFELPKWVNQIGEGAGLVKEALLFSYLVIEFNSRADAVIAWPANAYRIVSDLMKEKGRRECFVCTPDRGKCRARVLDSRQNADNQKFFELGRADLLKDLELSEKGDVLRLHRLNNY